MTQGWRNDAQGWCNDANEWKYSPRQVTCSWEAAVSPVDSKQDEDRLTISKPSSVDCHCIKVDWLWITRALLPPLIPNPQWLRKKWCHAKLWLVDAVNDVNNH